MHVDLVPGTSLATLSETLRDVHAKLGNTRSAGGAGQRFDAYVNWANQAAFQLRQLVRPRTLEALVLTPVYWRIVELSAQKCISSIDIVDRETQDGLDRLQRAQDWIVQREKTWRSRHLLVADTSFLINADKLEDIDLREIVGVREQEIHWLFPIVVLDELDRLKESKQQPARWRASYSLSVLERVISDPRSPGLLQQEDFSALDSGGIPRGKVWAEVVLDPPGHERLPLADDELIDRAATLQALACAPVVFATYDTSQAMRARGADLTVKHLRRPEEPEPPAS